MDSTQADLFDQGGDDGAGMTLAHYAEQAYLDYAVSVVRGRALPDVADGQKPVQRRILYAMQAMGLGAGAKPVKSARVVGDVLGKYHPHGDQAAYDAMVRMAQDFTLRYPLVDGHGNFGSRDGDNAAAMRYTEARLTPFARILLDELDEGTVDFIANYDGSQKEPVLLPARLPVMLLNGASGIAVGMATEIPSHNLREVANACVALIRNPKLPDEELYALVPGPDYAGGGQIISSPADIAHIYATGRGSIKARARWRFEELARGQWQLVAYELPPGTSAQKILEEIEDLTNPKVKAGKKSLTAEQQQTKALVLGMLDAVRDESGKDAAVRLVFEPKTSRIDRDEFVNLLLAQTSMEGNAPINLVCLGTDGRPRQKPLRQVLAEWLEFRAHTMTRRTEYRLDKVTDRIHVLEGRMVVYLNVDEVIQTIRESDEPKAALMARFELSERQAEDILEMRLRQLARLEGFKIEKELEERNTEQASLRELLDNPAAFKRLMVKEIEADAKQYGDDRRTLIETAERAVLESKVVEEPVTVIMSQKGWLRARQGHGHDAAQFGFKTGDALYDTAECLTTDELVAISNTGRVYTVAVSSLPSARGDGQPITSMIDLEPGARIVHMVAGPAEQRYVLGTRSGYGFIAKHKDLTTRQRAGKQFLSLEGSDTLLKPLVLRGTDTHVAMLARKGRFLVVDLHEFKSLSGGGRGTILMGLDEGDAVAQWVPVGPEGILVSGIYRAKDTTWSMDMQALAEYMGKRARKGKALSLKMKQPTLLRA
ncbi:topoisomerase-4 subunit A [Parapusillimonas granuli]|uniref:DNA topoisomerase 4 subunit A n=2 Tax=Parapusillimonas granuli TaxID=380911 RepID=A0A853G1M1_9BURK|nr:DNA topoisomerase IV subunit A [Parapusillimonas granuli]MBB5217049.1 topoisomerase-4 subunit A [Parapusillimonas granuli]MEB2400621.1 DNA topoisomerase IV subunit A [Alcaligenaceae bacterium]NYT50187.1 DNA topoisomerase IV subunit A [Parapusillimonas granuli]